MPYALTGRTITAWSLNADKTVLWFETTTGRVIMETEGDCCSHTWIESIDAPEALTGYVVNVEDIDMPDLEAVYDMLCKLGVHHDDDYIRFYGLRITTTRGMCVIDYRNSSNGYYGGSITETVDTYDRDV